MGRTERAIPNNLGIDGPKRPDNPHHAGMASHQRNLDASQAQIDVFLKEGEVILFDGTRATQINPPGVTDRPFFHTKRAGLG